MEPQGGEAIVRDWSAEARRIAAEIAAQHPRATVAELKALFRGRCPWGRTESWPYQAWLRAVRGEVEKRAEARRKVGQK